MSFYFGSNQFQSGHYGKNGHCSPTHLRTKLSNPTRPLFSILNSISKRSEVHSLNGGFVIVVKIVSFLTSKQATFLLVPHCSEPVGCTSKIVVSFIIRGGFPLYQMPLMLESNHMLLHFLFFIKF